MKQWLGVLVALGICAQTVAAVEARYVVVDKPLPRVPLSLAEVQVFVGGENVAPKGKAGQCATAWGGEAQRAIDGNTSGRWEHLSVTHTPEDGMMPMWEVDLGKTYPVDKVVLWNRDSYRDRIKDVRVLLLDANRHVMWSDTIKTNAMQHAFIPEKGKGEAVGQTVRTLDAHRKWQQNRDRIRFINPKALGEALQAYAADYPEAYPDVAELMMAIVAFETRYVKEGYSEALEKAYRELQKRVLLAHPDVAAIKEILFINRPKGTNQGLPQNYQSHTGWRGSDASLRGNYNNSLLRGPLCQDDGEAKVLKQSKAYLGELCLHWDGETVLLSSGEEKSGPWGLYEIQADGSDWRVAYREDDPEIDTYDACYLPDGRILTTSTCGFQGVPCVAGGDYVANLVVLDHDRKNPRRLTFEQDNNWNPQVYPNGRVIYLRWEYTDSAHYFSRVLMTMNPDGSDQQEFYGSNSYWPNSIFYHQNIPGSSTKFVGIVTGHHGVARKGELVKFDVSQGRIETQGAVHKFPFRGQKVENITKDQLVDHISPFFLHPMPLNEDLVLASMQRNGNAPFELVLVDTYDNVLTLWSDPDANYYEITPLRATEPPPMRADVVNPEKTTCNVYMSNVYRGQKTLDGVPHGAVKQLRVYQYVYSPRNIGGHYNVGMEGGWDMRVLHGTVDVEEDGSCMFEFPANTPFTVQPLDDQGRALQMMRSWLVGMPGETISCIGCHESQNVAPPIHPTAASLAPPQQVKPWDNYEPHGWAFDRELQPVLDRKCVGCHNAGTTLTNAMGAKIPDFTYRPNEWNGFSSSYIALHPYVRRNGPEGDYHVLTPLEFHATTSDLYQLLTKGHHNVKLTQDEMNRFIMWMDMNVPYFGTWTERGANPHTMAQRAKYEKRYAGLTFNPEKIVNPYTPGKETFEHPAMTLEAPPVTPTLAGWPFTAKASDQKVTLDVGGGHKLTAIKIPAGKFVMGSNAETPVEAPEHIAEVKKDFYMGTTEVTMGMMQQFDPDFENGVYDMHYKDQVRRGYFVNNPAFPAIRVSYDQAEAFCEWLSQKSGKTVRLPTEVEWEYACRAGTNTPMNYGDINTNFSKQANLADITMKQFAVWGIDPQPIRNPDKYMDYELKDVRSNDGVLHLAKVGSYAPNGFGLYDMHGNVAEWTSSPFVGYADAKPSGAFDATKRVIRGGSWYQRPMRATSSIRWGYPMWQRPYNVGFRVVIEE